MSSDAQIDYESLVQEAMRGVLKAILQRVAKTGLPGEHHFYISFNTRAPGVGLSKRLKERYPEEMTVVLQHRFWDLIVHDDRFEVKLTFDSIPERLVVPFASVRVFVDPSVRFGHQFEDPNATEDGTPGEPVVGGGTAGDVTTIGGRGRRTGDKKRTSVGRKSRGERGRDTRDETSEPAANGDGDEAETPMAASKRAGAPTPTPTLVPHVEVDVDAEPEQSAKVVSLDKFRKK